MDLLDEIKLVISDCEYVQDSNESDYTKERTKISAYEAIKEILNMRKGCNDGK